MISSQEPQLLTSVKSMPSCQGTLGWLCWVWADPAGGFTAELCQAWGTPECLAAPWQPTWLQRGLQHLPAESTWSWAGHDQGTFTRVVCLKQMFPKTSNSRFSTHTPLSLSFLLSRTLPLTAPHLQSMRREEGAGTAQPGSVCTFTTLLPACTRSADSFKSPGHV